MKEISNLSYKLIKDYLCSHKEDIALSINDFDTLEIPLKEMTGEYQPKTATECLRIQRGTTN